MAYSNVIIGFVNFKSSQNITTIKANALNYNAFSTDLHARDLEDKDRLTSCMMDGWRHGRTDGGFGLTHFFVTPPEPVSINNDEFTSCISEVAPGN